MSCSAAIFFDDFVDLSFAHIELVFEFNKFFLELFDASLCSFECEFCRLKLCFFVLDLLRVPSHLSLHLSKLH